MNISSVSSTAINVTSSVNENDSSIKSLEAQEVSLQSQLQQTNSSKMDEKTKQANVFVGLGAIIRKE